ncbi:MAG TPA: helix-turn-helix domain-containing protein [Arsenophonus nasoniae]|uniref:helix-turn-helix domain-containing protein n=1 Tax=Arsenophonus nasoniae TaxID=638 RepID=UPI0038790589
MFVDFIHNWHFTSVISKLQQSSASSPDISSAFKVNPQTLTNTSMPPYSKNEEIIPDQSSIQPFKIRPNHYLNISQCNLTVKKMAICILR